MFRVLMNQILMLDELQSKGREGDIYKRKEATKRITQN